MTDITVYKPEQPSHIIFYLLDYFSLSPVPFFQINNLNFHLVHLLLRTLAARRRCSPTLLCYTLP